jgi:CelD/BcsL family acetyltransferase involved in cellulose biosynthesis
VKVESGDRLESVGPEAWDALLADSRLRSPFLSWTWQQHWATAFAPDRRVDVRRVVDGEGRLVAVLPLYEAAPGVLELIGGADVSDYLDLLARAGQEEAAWAVLLHARAAARERWVLHAVPAASPTVRRLPGLAGSCSLVATAELEERCPVLTLPASWDAYLASLSGKHRHELTRKIRRFEREIPDGRVVAVHRADEVAARLGDFLALHRASRVGKAKFMDERMEAFFRAAIPALAAREGVRLWLLEAAAEPIASFICLEWDATVGLYNSGFAPSRAALSPGLVLLSHVIRDAIARRRARFDFLRGEERYKLEFEPTLEDVFRVEIASAAAPVSTSPPTSQAGLASPATTESVSRAPRAGSRAPLAESHVPRAPAQAPRP